jgi:hypothetical protein
LQSTIHNGLIEKSAGLSFGMTSKLEQQIHFLAAAEQYLFTSK